MSFLGRLFGGKTDAARATSVVIDPAVAASLTAGGADLASAVDAALRAHLASLSADAQPELKERPGPERIPFWLERDSERSGELEDELRDRVIQRHESEDASHQ